MPRGKHAAKGRNLCRKDQQFDITPPRNNRRSLPYTLPRPGKSKTNKPQQRYQKLDVEASDTRGVQKDPGSRSAQHGDRQGRRQELLRRVNDEKNARLVVIVFCF